MFFQDAGCVHAHVEWTSFIYLRNGRWGGSVYVFRCFFLFFVFFCFFSVRHKNTRQPFSGTAERIFMKLLPNNSGENVVSNVVLKWGLGTPINFLGAKNYTLRTWWWRLASESELVCWLWHCAAMAVALKRHERVNAFNLVYFYLFIKKRIERVWNGRGADSEIGNVFIYLL